MLNSEYIHSKLTNIQECSGEDAIHFASMIELYPYASSFSILYLKSLSNSKDIRFDSELEKHAFRIQSRGVLFDLINVKEKILISEIKFEFKHLTSTFNYENSLDELIKLFKQNNYSEVFRDKENITFKLNKKL